MTIKKILSLLLVLSLICCGLLFTVSCAPDEPTDDDNKNNHGNNNGGGNTADKGLDYTVTLVDINENPIEGISLKFTYGDKQTGVYTTNAEGKATAKIDTYDDVIVEFVDLVGYGNLAKRERNLNGETEKTIVMPQLYTVVCVDSEGNAIEGVEIKICHNVCLSPIETNSEGKAVAGIIPKADVKVAVVSVPEGYKLPEKIGEYDADTPIHASFSPDSYTLTIVIPNN